LVFAERDDTDTQSSPSTVPAPHHPRDPRIAPLDHHAEATPVRTLQNLHPVAPGVVRPGHPSLSKARYRWKAVGAGRARGILFHDGRRRTTE
jgi:hypothetical protein